MIKIGKPYIEHGNNEKSRLYCNIKINKIEHLIWFEVPSLYSKYLCVERTDAYVIGLLHYALENGYDIECEVPMTEDLKYNIEKILIPSLVNYGKNLHSIKIISDTAPSLNIGNEIGTGLSCGIDSFSAVVNHTNSNYKNMDITMVCINNVGAFNECYTEYGAKKVKEERYEKTVEVAKYLNLNLLETDSNFADEIYQNHLLTSTYSTCFAIHCLQKLWSIYYLGSSGLDYSTFEIKNNDLYSCEHYELLSLQCFSIPGLRIYSEGGEKNRLEKTKDLIDFTPAQKYLHVCLSKPYNDNMCSKCMRTLTTLDALNALEKFNEVFDIEYYKNNKRKFYKWTLEEHYKKYIMNEPTYKILNDRKEFRSKVFFLRVPLYLKSRKYCIKEYLKSKLSGRVYKMLKSTKNLIKKV